MGVKYFEKSKQSADHSAVYDCKETISSGVNGSIFLLSEGTGKINRITIFIHAQAGSGHIKQTNSPRDEVIKGNGVWTNTELGTVSGKSDSIVISPVTAIRLIRESGTVTMEATAQ